MTWKSTAAVILLAATYLAVLAPMVCAEFGQLEVRAPAAYDSAFSDAPGDYRDDQGQHLASTDAGPSAGQVGTAGAAAAVPPPSDWLLQPANPLAGLPCIPPLTLPPPTVPDDWVACWGAGFLARGYYLNDQRIAWSGMETSFGGEGVLVPVVKHRFADWETTIEGEFYLNQPFDRNYLNNSRERASYAANFRVDTFETSQLLVTLRHGNLLVGAGKMITPFGRTYFPLYSNARLDAPFIRTESILWRETGLLVRYHPGWLVGDVALTNGSENRDSNSSKALVSRIGIEDERWAAGVSVKVQDGIGSDEQKEVKNHVGADLMFRLGRFTISGEAIYDEYGFRHPDFDPDNITWGRSIYYRDQNYRLNVPITGIGYYANLGYQGQRWSGALNYGEFYPARIGDPRHDIPNRRGMIKVVYALAPHLQSYNVVMLETEGQIAQTGRPRKGAVILTGLQYEF